MVWRIVSFLLCQLAGGLIGGFVVSQAAWLTGALAGVIVGGLCWFLIDLSRGVQFLEWLRLGDASTLALKTGLWGEVSDRVRRLMRAREKMTLESENRLQDFLAALQASPNGVVLLDSQGRIEWFNQIAASHFGLDAQRDLLQHFGNLVRDPGFVNYFASHDFLSELLMSGRQVVSSPSPLWTRAVVAVVAGCHCAGAGRGHATRFCSQCVA